MEQYWVLSLASPFTAFLNIQEMAPLMYGLQWPKYVYKSHCTQQSKSSTPHKGSWATHIVLLSAGIWQYSYQQTLQVYLPTQSKVRSCLSDGALYFQPQDMRLLGKNVSRNKYHMYVNWKEVGQLKLIGWLAYWYNLRVEVHKFSAAFSIKSYFLYIHYKSNVITTFVT